MTVEELRKLPWSLYKNVQGNPLAQRQDMWVIRKSFVVPSNATTEDYNFLAQTALNELLLEIVNNQKQ